MDSESLGKIRYQCRRYLDSLSPHLYAGKEVDFDFSEAYWDFDSMLKREIAYFSVTAAERLAMGRLVRKSENFELSITQNLASQSGIPNRQRQPIHSFLIDRKFLEPSGHGRYRLMSPALTGDFFLGVVREGEVLLRGRPSLEVAGEWGPDPFEPDRIVKELISWFQGALSAWISGEPDARVFPVAEDPAFPIRVVAGRAFSRIDMDSSRESPAHVFRWKELSKGAVKCYRSLALEECIGIVNRHGLEIPPDAKSAGITRSEQPDGGDCISIRFLHHIPDPESPSSAQMPNAPWKHRGSIVVEGDYQEYLIDGATGTLIGLERKWRPMPPTPEPTGDRPRTAAAC